MDLSVAVAVDVIMSVFVTDVDDAVDNNLAPILSAVAADIVVDVTVDSIVGLTLSFDDDAAEDIVDAVSVCVFVDAVDIITVTTFPAETGIAPSGISGDIISPEETTGVDDFVVVVNEFDVLSAVLRVVVFVVFAESFLCNNFLHIFSVFPK